MAIYRAQLSVDFSGLTSVDATAKTDGYEPYWDGGGLVLKGAPPRSINVRRKGARGDLVTLTDGAMTAGSNQLSSAATFSNATLDAGKPIQVRGAGTTTARGTGNTAGTTNTIIAATGWWMPGMFVTGTGIPANTEIVDVQGLYGSAAGLTLVLNKNLTGAGGAGTALSMVNSVNGYISSDFSGGVARIVTAPGGSTPVNATTTVAGVKVRYATDDTTAVGNAYALAALVGADIAFPDGSYAVNNLNLTIPKVRFTSSKGATLYHLFGTSAPNPMFARGSAVGGTFTDVEFVGLNLEGDPTATSGSPAAIFISGAGIERIRVERCTFRYFHDAAAAVYHTNGVAYVNNIARFVCAPGGRNAFNAVVDGTSGAPAQASTWPGAGRSVITGNQVTDCATAGVGAIAIGQAKTAMRQKATVNNNILTRCGWAGIVGENNGGTRGMAVQGNQIYSCAVGINVQNTNSGSYAPGYADNQNVTIQGNVIDSENLGGSTATGIVCTASNAVVQGNTVRVPSNAINIAGQSASSRAYNQTVANNTLICCNTNTGSPQFMMSASNTDGAQIVANKLTVESEFDYIDLTGATAGTFTASVVDSLTSTNVTTAAIAYNATAATVQAALVAALPANMSDAVVVTQATGVPVHEVHFQRRLAGRPITLTCDFSGVTGGTPVVTVVQGGAQTHHQLNASDTSRLRVSGNVFEFAGLNAVNLTDCRDGRLDNNTIIDPNVRNNGAAGVGCGIAHSGDVGILGLDIEDNKIVDRRASAAMNYAVYLVAGGSTGTPVRLKNNTLLGWKTSDVNDRTLVNNEGGTTFSASAPFTNVVKNNGLREGTATAAPTTGTWSVGDRIRNSAPAVGSPKGWVCTVAGTPGTWVSEGNL